MSITKSEKFVAVTKTYVEKTRRESDYRSLGSSTSLIAIRGLARESYPVVYELAGWMSAPAIARVDRRRRVVTPKLHSERNGSKVIYPCSLGPP